MIGKALYQKKERVMMFLWIYGAMIGVGLLLLPVAVMKGSDRAAMSGVGMVLVVGAVNFLMTKAQSKKPMVVLGDDHLEIVHPRRQLIRYREMLKVKRPAANRIVVEASKEGGGSRKVTIFLSELEREQGEQLATFLTEKASAN